MDPTTRLIFDYEVTVEAYNRLYAPKKQEGKTVADQIRKEYIR